MLTRCLLMACSMLACVPQLVRAAEPAPDAQAAAPVPAEHIVIDLREPGPKPGEWLNSRRRLGGFSRDGRVLLTLGESGQSVGWRTSDGTRAYAVGPEADPGNPSAAAGDRVLAAWPDAGVYVFGAKHRAGVQLRDIGTGAGRAAGEDAKRSPAATCADARVLAYADAPRERSRVKEGGSLVGLADCDAVLVGVGGPPRTVCVAFDTVSKSTPELKRLCLSADGSRLAGMFADGGLVCWGADGRVRARKARDAGPAGGSPEAILQPRSELLLRFGPDGRTLRILDGRRLWAWDTADPDTLTPLRWGYASGRADAGDAAGRARDAKIPARYLQGARRPAALSPDGRYAVNFASLTDDGAATVIGLEVIDLSSMRAVGEVRLPTAEGPRGLPLVDTRFERVVFSPGSDRGALEISRGSAKGGPRLHAMTTAELVRLAGGHAVLDPDSPAALGAAEPREPERERPKRRRRGKD